MKKVVLIGPESTGKSTIAKKLANYYNTVWSPEYVRFYLDIKNKTPQIKNPDNQIVTLNDIEPIAIGQIAFENLIQSMAKNLIIYDTNLISTKIYCQHYFGFYPEWIYQHLINRQKDHLYLLLDIDIPFSIDEQRDSSQNRKEIFNLFRNELITNQLSFKIIHGSYNDRFNQCVKLINSWIKN